MEKNLLPDQTQVQDYKVVIDTTLDLQTLVNNLPVLMAQLDAGNRFLFANTAFIEWFKTPSISGIRYKTLEEVLGTPVFKALQPQLESVLKGQKQSFEFTFSNQEQKIHSATVTLIPYSFKEDQVTSYLLIIQDITHQKEIETAVKLQSAALEAAANGIVITDQNGSIVWANHAVSKMTCYTLDELIGQNPRTLKSGKHDDSFYQSMWNTISMRKIWQGEVINRRKDGSLYVEEMTITPIRNGDLHRITHYIAVKQDITQRKRAEEALKESENRYRALVENQGEGAAIVDKALRFEYANLAVENILGIPVKEIIGKSLRDFLPVDQKNQIENQLATRKAGKTSTYELTLFQMDGTRRTVLITATPRFDNSGEYSGSFAIFRDITERKEIEVKLRYQSAHDVLTHLFNRLYFEEEMQRLEHSRVTPVSIIVVDIDSLKIVNDSKGHLTGDELIKSVAQVLKQSFRTEDMVARIGGDEFAILLPQTDQQELQKSIERLKNNLKKANRTNTHPPISISIGGATAEANEPLIDVFKLADERMYTDKKSRRRRE